MSKSQPTPEIPCVLVCKADNTKPLVNLLSAIHTNTSKKDQMALCTLSPHGIKFTVEEGKIFQAHTFLQAELFQEYHWGEKSEDRVPFKAEGLRDALSELDWTSPNISFLLSPEAPYFRVSSATTIGSFETEYPRQSDIFENFECSKKQLQHYKTSLLQPCFKALMFANRTQIKMNNIGVLSFQHMIKVEDRSGFVDFYLLPEDPPDDESQ